MATLAIVKLSQGDVEAAQPAIEILLDRGALAAARSALQTFPAEKDVPAISFLRGRLAWQLVKAGSKNYNPEDARRYWETAVKQKPSVEYLNALGFAYYTEGNLEGASSAWFQSIALLEQQKSSQQNAAKSPAQDALVAYSGLALVSMKLLNGQSADEQTRLKEEAVKLRDQVLRQAPTEFQPDALVKNWLWTEKMIQNWKAILALKQSKP